MQEFCPWDAPQYLIFSENTPTLLLYSHGISIIAAVLLGALLLMRNRSLLTGLFFSITALFSVWALFDMFQWATNRPDTLLFYWTLSVVIEIAIYILCYYLAQVFITKKDISFRHKIFLTALLMPILVLAPTTHLLPGVFIEYCNALETPFVIYYTYGVQILLILGLFIRSASLIRTGGKVSKTEGWLFVTGIIIFLLAFSSGNIVGSITENWDAAQFGLFGMPIFIGFLVYLIIKYKSFNSRLFGAQILVGALLVLTASLQLSRTVETSRIIAGITFAITLVVGTVLIRNVRREIKQREKLEQVTQELGTANDKLKGLDKLKTEFLSLASHQLRTPLTAIKGYASMLFEGSFGTMDDKQNEAAKRIYTSAQGLANIVEDLLNVSKIEQGGMKYEMMPTDVAKLVRDLYNEMKIPAENKKLAFTLKLNERDSFMATADPLKLKQVFLNLTDNSIKYTESGFVTLALVRDGANIVFSVSDSGVGVTPETKAKLFDKFARGEGGKMNTGGSGLGLYLAREITRAHKGDVDIISDGAGKGATFVVTIPGSGAGSRGIPLS